MDLSRLRSAMDVERLQACKVALIGVGGSADLAVNLVRCGIQHLTLVDPDRVGRENVARQGHQHDDLNLPKVEALARRLKTINPEVKATALAEDFTVYGDAAIDAKFQSCDLLIFATDRFKAQARGNEVALRLKKPALWIGLYARGAGGEVIFWRPQINACYRCLVAARYLAQTQAQQAGASLDPPSDGATIFDIHYVDSIAGQLAIGLLTRGAQNRFGQLIDALGDRNFIQVNITPAGAVGQRDVVREKLEVPPGNDAYFAWNAIALRDPTAHVEACPDCCRFRGDATGKPLTRRTVGDGSVRLWPAASALPARISKNGRGGH